MASAGRVQLDPSLANNSNLFASDGDQINYIDPLTNGQHAWSSADPSMAYGHQYGSSAFSQQQWSQPVNQQISTNPTTQYSNPPQVFANQFYSNNHNQMPFQAAQGSNPTFDSGLSATSFLQQQQSVTQQHQTPYQNMPSATISPTVLQPSHLTTGTSLGNQMSAHNVQIRPNYSAPPLNRPLPEPSSSVTRPEPPSAVDEGQFHLLPYEALTTATQSRRLLSFVNIGSMTQDMPLTKSTVPNYVPRKSLKEVKKMAATNTQLAARLAKDKAPKVSKILVPKLQANAKPSVAGTLVKVSGAKGDVDLVSLGSSSEDESEYESSSDEEEAESSPLPATRPQQPLEAARYDTIKAVWLPRNKFAKPDQIRVGLKDFWEVVKTIRDQWKSDNEAVKRAVDAKREGQIPMLKDRVKLQRDSLEMVMRATFEHGHNDIIRLCGENKPMMFALYQFLHACLKDGDYESSFIQTALKFLTRCSTLSNEVLDATSLRKAVDRFAKRGTPTSKALAQKVLDNADHKKAQAAKQIASSKPIDAKAKLALNASAKGNPSPEKGSIKRPLPAEGSAAPVKRPAVASSAGSTVNKPGMPSKKPTLSADKSANPAAGAVKTKTVVTKAPTHSLFASLNVPKRTPATIAAAKQRAAAAAAAEVQNRPTVTAPSSSVFAQLLTKTKNPVEEIKKPAEKNLPPETAEQKAKRIRKEERRKLRVSFKPDAQLCEIKLFHHDPEEELGHDANMVRDVSDINSEGRMFKQHKEMMDIDDEDDEPTEKTFFDYKRPVTIDLSTIDKDTSDRGFEKTGGIQKADSPERILQDIHVANTIMVHYFTRTDIPPCPKEPFDPYTGVRQELQIGGQPAPDTVYSQRAKAMAPVLAPISTPSIDINAILQGLTPMASQASSMQPQMPTLFAAQPQPQPQPQTAADNSLAAIQNILAQFAQPAAQPQQPAQPQWQMPAPQSAPPMAAQQPAVPSGVDAFLASLQQGPGPAAAAAAPAMPPPTTQTAEQAAAAAQWAAMYGNAAWGQAPAANTGAPDAAALLAMFSGNNGNNAATNSYGNYGGYNQQQNDDMYGDGTGYNDRKRGHDDNEDYDQRGGKFQKNGANRKKDWDAPDHSNKPRFVVQCKFYKEGKCRKGADCTFRHD